MWDAQFDKLLRQRLPFLPPDEPLDADSSLRDYGLDSLATVELLGELENTYRIRFPEDLLTLDTFATPQVLWQALTTVRTASP